MADEKKLARLKVVLDVLEVAMSVDAMDCRLTMQKAIYIAQVTGVNLGYRFGWYLRGPYCSELADDYFEARTYSEQLKPYVASDDLRTRLHKAKATIDGKPDDASATEWLETVASLDYMRRVQHVTSNDLRAKFSQEKPKLVHLYDDGLAARTKYLRDA